MSYKKSKFQKIIKYNITNLKCLKKEKMRIFSKLVLFSNKDIDRMSLILPNIIDTDKFFNDPQDFNSSHINTNDYDNNLIMTRGYASAAVFFLKIISSSSSDYVKACYINPCLYCFRHYIELSLKDTLWHYYYCTHNIIDLDKINNEHNLSSLWEMLLPLLKRDSKTKNVGRLLHELSDVDKSGTTFRYSYSFNKTGRENNKGLQMNISNKILHTRMLQLYRFFEGLNSEITNGLDEITSYNN